jgi:hypothetical protein
MTIYPKAVSLMPVFMNEIGFSQIRDSGASDISELLVLDLAVSEKSHPL